MQFHKAVAGTQFCVHSNSMFSEPELECRVFTGNKLQGKFHGWLCDKHYYNQQAGIPANPRKPQVITRKQYLTDDQFVAEIVRSEAVAIAAESMANNIRKVSYGTHDPAVFVWLEK